MYDSRQLGQAVFSTHVEVFLGRWFSGLDFSCFLHARGGVSFPDGVCEDALLFSPRTWRCFRPPCCCHLRYTVFSTHVEVFLIRRASSAEARGFLHARGGVSCCMM